MRLEALLKILDVEGAVARTPEGWERTDREYHYDTERIERVEAARAVEAAAMIEYQQTDACLMAFLRRQLDDVNIEPCGRCTSCLGVPVDGDIPPGFVADAQAFLRGVDHVIEARKQWPASVDGARRNIPPAARAEPGRALAERGDGGWSETVERLLAGSHAAGGADSVPDDLGDAMARALKRWRWESRPAWITWVPSRDPVRQALLGDLAARLGDLGRLPVLDVIRRVRDGRPQHTLVNSEHQAANVLGVFALDPGAVGGGLPAGPALVLDDRVSSGWTFTAVAALLREAGVEAVLPFALLAG